jgi:hypothetical protein
LITIPVGRAGVMAQVSGIPPPILGVRLKEIPLLNVKKEPE